MLVATYRKPFPAILLGVEPWVCLQPPPSEGQPRGGPGPVSADSVSTHRKTGREGVQSQTNLTSDVGSVAPDSHSSSLDPSFPVWTMSWTMYLLMYL